MVRHEGGGKAKGKGKEKERSVKDDRERWKRRRRETGGRSRGGIGWSKLMYAHTTTDLGTTVSGQEVNYCTVLNKAC